MSMAHAFTRLQKAYRFLQDDLSRQVFKARLIYDITRSFDDVAHLAGTSGNYDEQTLAHAKGFSKRCGQIVEAGRKIIFYGAGTRGLEYLQRFSEDPEHVEIYGFCDRSEEKQKTGFHGKPVFSHQKLMGEHKDDYVLITTPLYEQEIRAALLRDGFPADHILDFLEDHLAGVPQQYFEFPLPKGGAFIDAGCFDCGTDLRFIEITGGLYDKIIAFEPDRLNMINCQKIAGENSIKNIELIPAGLWDKEEVLYFSECGQIDSHLDSQNGVPTRMVALDQIIKQERVSFIKMDVEGAELKALHGARRTIIENKPLLAICVYHKPEDFVEIAEFIKSLVPEYKLYLRHYGSLTYETVLYAVL